MVIGVCTVELELPTSFSLKDKRRIIQSLMRRIRNDFNVAVGEVDQQDRWQVAVLAFACVSTDAAYAHGLLTKVTQRIEELRLDANLVDFEIQML